MCRSESVGLKPFAASRAQTGAVLGRVHRSGRTSTLGRSSRGDASKHRGKQHGDGEYLRRQLRLPGETGVSNEKSSGDAGALLS